MRIMAVLVTAMMISIAFVANLDTYSFFKGTASSSVEVSAAETEDILELFELVYLNGNEQEENPIALRIRKAADLGYAPVVFFSVHGDIEDYMININPVKLESEGTYVIPLDISCSFGQLFDSAEIPDRVNGSITVEYLNDFISEELKLSYTKPYVIWNRYFNYEGKRDVTVEEPTGRLRTFSVLGEDLNFGENEEQLIQSYAYRSLLYMAKQVEWENVASDSGMNLTEEQDSLIGIIFPGLTEYIKRLENTAADLKAQLSEKALELADLNGKLESMESQYEELLEENQSLTEQVNSLSETTAVQPSTPDTGTGAVDAGNSGETGTGTENIDNGGNAETDAGTDVGTEDTGGEAIDDEVTDSEDPETDTDGTESPEEEEVPTGAEDNGSVGTEADSPDDSGDQDTAAGGSDEGAAADIPGEGGE